VDLFLRKSEKRKNKNVDFRLRPQLALPRALNTKEIFIEFSQFSPENLEIEMDYREFIFMAFVFCYQFVGVAASPCYPLNLIFDLALKPSFSLPGREL
jgi:hypothetical protein